MKSAAFFTISLICYIPKALAFSTDLFPTATRSLQQRFPTKDHKGDIELPNFDELFGRIKQVSPLARITLDNDIDSNLGLNAIDKFCE
jgi:hypothetical protein